MFAVLSPAKKLAENVRQLPSSQPDLLGHTEELVGVMRQKSVSDLMSLMGISEKLATLNQQRYQDFSTPFVMGQNSEPASLMFAGDTYVGLDVDSLEDDDLLWSQKHLGILSGLYGLLRPLDLVAPYRLEMGTKLNTERGKNLYSFWGGRITQLINDRLKEQENKSVINLASNEYFKSVHARDLEGVVITPVFKELRDGKAKVISFMAKRARGAMAKFIIANRLTDPASLKAFVWGGYRFVPESSTDVQWVFVR